MRIFAALAFALTMAACSPPRQIEWLETAQLVEGPPVLEAPVAEGDTPPAVDPAPAQVTHRFFIGQGEAPEGATLNVWAFKIESPDDEVGAFQLAHPAGADLTASIMMDGASTPLGDVVRTYSIENPLIGVYAALPETTADWAPCGGRPLSHIVFIYHPYRADLAATVLAFADGRPGQDTSIYCGARQFYIPS